MNAAVTLVRKAISIANRITNFAVWIFLFLMIAYGSYAIWDSNTIVESAAAKQYEIYKPAKGGGPSFAELQTINPEVCAWLTLYGTTVDYPVAQADTNWKYVTMNVKCEYSLTGSIFMDYQNKNDFSDFNTIIYGHNMTPRVMFGDIKSFLEKSFFDSHAYGDLFYGGKHHGIELFAIISTDAYDAAIYSPGIESEEAKTEYLKRIVDKSIYRRDIGVTEKSSIVLLSTCSNTATNERNILVGKITDNTYENEFTVAEDKKDTTLLGVDVKSILNIMSVLPLWIWILLITAILLSLFAIIHRYRKKRRERKKKNG